jgi:hypothetical protein
MPRKWSELYLRERLDLLLRFLEMVDKRPDLTVGGLREEFARTYDLSPEAARHMDDILWFSGFITTAYRGVPPRPYRVLTPEGSARLSERSLEFRHFDLAPEWVRRSLRRAPKIPVAPQVLRFDHGDFTFWIERDWDYKVYVEGPYELLQPWQTRLDPDYMRLHGVIIPRDTMLYSIKNRTTALLDTIGIQEAANRTRMYQLLGYRWVPWNPEYETARIMADRPQSRKKGRFFIIDPDGKVRVWRLPYLAPGRSRYCVDLSAVPGLPPQIDLVKGKTRLDERVPAGRALFVARIWS